MQFSFDHKKIGFNSEWVAKQSFATFCENEKHHNLTKKQLSEVYKMCKALHKDSSFNQSSQDNSFEVGS
jgi:hypothetical protein